MRRPVPLSYGARSWRGDKRCSGAGALEGQLRSTFSIGAPRPRMGPWATGAATYSREVFGDDVQPPAELDRRRHLATLHQGWATPRWVIEEVVGEVTSAPVLDLRRIVAGEQNEVYDVTV